MLSSFLIRAFLLMNRISLALIRIMVSLKAVSSSSILRCIWPCSLFVALSFLLSCVLSSLFRFKLSFIRFSKPHFLFSSLSFLVSLFSFQSSCRIVSFLSLIYALIHLLPLTLFRNHLFVSSLPPYKGRVSLLHPHQVDPL